MGGEFWFYYLGMQIPLLNYTKQSSLPHNFWGKEENQSVTNHHGAFCCQTCVFPPVHRTSYPPEHGDQVWALAVVMYRSVTNWVIIRAHKHPFIVVIGLILHPSSILRRGSSDCKYNCFGCTRRAVAGSVANVSLFTVLDTLSYIHNTPAILNRLMELEKMAFIFYGKFVAVNSQSSYFTETKSITSLDLFHLDDIFCFLVNLSPPQIC